MIIIKRHTSKLTLETLANYCKKFCSDVSILCYDRNHSLIWAHVYRSYPAILSLCLILIRVEETELACLYLIQHMLMQIIMHTSCAFTSALYTSLIFYANLCMHTCKMLNVMFCISAAHTLDQV